LRPSFRPGTGHSGTATPRLFQVEVTRRTEWPVSIYSHLSRERTEPELGGGVRRQWPGRWRPDACHGGRPAGAATTGGDHNCYSIRIPVRAGRRDHEDRGAHSHRRGPDHRRDRRQLRTDHAARLLLGLESLGRLVCRAATWTRCPPRQARCAPTSSSVPGRASRSALSACPAVRSRSSTAAPVLLIRPATRPSARSAVACVAASAPPPSGRPGRSPWPTSVRSLRVSTATAHRAPVTPR